MGSPTVELTPPVAASPLDGLRPALLGWLGARVAVVLGIAVAHGLSGTVSMPDGRLHLEQGLMTWDATYYKVIAEGWYGGAGTPRDAVRFFPAYPGLARLLSPVFAGRVDIPLLLIANLSALAAAFLLWRLAIEVTGDRAVADRSAWMVAVIPAANILAFGYSEGLTLLVVVAALLALHRRSLVWVAGLGLVAGLLRPVGILLMVPVGVEMWRWWRGGGTPAEAEGPAGPAHPTGPFDRSVGMVAAWTAALLAPAAGFLAALLWVAGPDGDPLDTFRIQRELRNGFHEPFTRLLRAFVDFGHGHLHDVYNVAFALGFLALFVVAWRRRQPASWLALMGTTWVVAVGGNRMDSVGRYCLVAAPFAVALAQWAGRRWQQVAVAVVGAAGIVWFTAEVMLGRIIP